MVNKKFHKFSNNYSLSHKTKYLINSKFMLDILSRQNIARVEVSICYHLPYNSKPVIIIGFGIFLE